MDIELSELEEEVLRKVAKGLIPVNPNHQVKAAIERLLNLGLIEPQEETQSWL